MSAYMKCAFATVSVIPTLYESARALGVRKLTLLGDITFYIGNIVNN